MAFKDIIGQDKAISILLHTFSRGRIPSAYLFAGESGIGKRLTAINLAKAINCLKGCDALSVSRDELNGDTHYSLPITGYDLDACDECDSCKKIDAKTHPDLLLVTPEKGEIRINEIRAVEDALSFRPYEGRRKVVIIDDADTMNQPAANAFLKTLEEPPSESLLILITSNPDILPETIRSRCSRVNFTPLPSEACKKVIKAAGSRQSAAGAKGRGHGVRGQESENLEGSHLLTTVRLSMGRPGVAISSDLLKDRERFIDLLKIMLKGGNDSWADRDEMEEWLGMAAILMRDIVALKIAGDGDVLLNADIEDFISEISKMTDIRDIIKTYDKINLLKGQMDFNLNKAITWNYMASIIKSVMRYS